MYTTLIEKVNGKDQCDSETFGSTFIYKVISSTDTLLQPGSKFAVLLFCHEKTQDDLEVGKHYNLFLSDEESHNGKLVTDFLVDKGDFIKRHNGAQSIYWVTKMNEMNSAFVRMAEVKLGIAEFPMEKLDRKRPLGSNYEATSDDYPRENEDELFAFSNYSFPTEDEYYLKEGKTGIFVDTNEREYYHDRYEGYQMYVYNNSTDTSSFPSIDTRIYLIAQAQDEHGEWFDIAKPSYSDCSFSYFSVKLNPGNQWFFVAPLPSGEHKTKIRMSVSFNATGERKIVYSNEYIGHINWEQLIKE